MFEKFEITLIINIQRDGKEIEQIKFIVFPPEYNDIINLKGAHRGYLTGFDKEIIINFLPTDIIVIVSDNYQEVKENFIKHTEEKNNEWHMVPWN